MNKVIPMRRCLASDPVPICPINAIDDDALDVRLWAQIQTGQRGSPVYLGNEDNVFGSYGDVEEVRAHSESARERQGARSI